MRPGVDPASEKWLPGISSGVKAAGAYGWRPTTLVVPNVKKMQGLTDPEPLGPVQAYCGMTFIFTSLNGFSQQNTLETWH